MNTNLLRLIKVSKTAAMIALVSTIISCGKDEPPPPPPAQPPPPPGAPGIGGGLEANPGSPTAFNINELMANLSGEGTANVTAETNTVYTIDYGNGQTPPVLRPLGAPTGQSNPQVNSPGFYVSGRSAPGGYGGQGGFQIVLQGAFGPQVFQLVQSLPLAHGITVWTTDAQAVFVGGGDAMGMPYGMHGGGMPLTILKVGYKTRNTPPMQLFSVYRDGGGQFGGQPGGFQQPPGPYPQQPMSLLKVNQKNLNTNIAPRYGGSQFGGGQPGGFQQPGPYQQQPVGYPGGYGQPQPYGYPQQQPGYGGGYGW